MAYMLQAAAGQRGAELALIDETGATTWREANDRVNRLIRVLRAAGLGLGDRIAVFAGNSRSVFELMAAAHHAGISYVPVNWHFSAEELAYVLQDSAAKALFTDSEFAALAGHALALAASPHASAKAAPASIESAIPSSIRPRIEFVVCLDGQAPGMLSLDDLLAKQSDASEPPAQAPGGPMFYTSGTTGQPKGVLRKVPGGSPPISSLNMLAQGLVHMLQLPTSGVTLLCGPLYHSAQWSFAFLPWLAGSCVLMSRRFDAAATLSLIDQHAVTNVHLVPTQFARLLRLDDTTKRAFSGRTLRRVWHGAAPCPPGVKRAMIDWWGPCIHEYYGSTEGAVVTGISSPEWLQRPGSVGRPIGRVAVQVLRDDLTPAPAGEAGTVYLRNLNGVVLQYHNDPTKTAAAHLASETPDPPGASGLYTTGDVGFVDAEGYLTLTDRKIDMIISGGVNIYPAEIESILAAHPAVHEVAVIGVPNEEFGEEVKALVELAPGQTGDAALADMLTQFCREHLAGFKLPKSIEFRTNLPRTATGKLQKRLLREPYWAGTGRRI